MCPDPLLASAFPRRLSTGDHGGGGWRGGVAEVASFCRWVCGTVMGNCYFHLEDSVSVASWPVHWPILCNASYFSSVVWWGVVNHDISLVLQRQDPLCLFRTVWSKYVT